MSVQDRPRGERVTRSWVAETLVVAGVLAFGFFAVSLEAGSGNWTGLLGPIADIFAGR